jgi:hypothetical protein
MEDDYFEWAWPTGAGADHVHRRQVELVKLLADRTPIFLDTNFWVMARQAAFGESDDSDLISLLGALRLAVESGKAFFPITSDLIAEFSKQSPDRLAATMTIVDRLSLGVAMVPHYERTAIEMERFNARAFPAAPPQTRPLWTCYAFALGYEDLRPPGVDVDDHLLVALAETAWRAQPSILAQQIPPEMFGARSDSARVAAYLNEQEALHAHEIDSHASALRIEVAGATAMLEGIAAREYRRMAAAAGEQAQAEDITGSRDVGKRITSMIAEALKQDVNRRSFGSLYVPAMLHASVRAEANRKIKPNDIFDFRHAAAALPYCRAFLTDRPLKTLITSGHVRLDTLYGCEVIASPKEAIELIGRLVLS